MHFSHRIAISVVQVRLGEPDLTHGTLSGWKLLRYQGNIAPLQYIDTPVAFPEVVHPLR
jgi:hypothetical protein